MIEALVNYIEERDYAVDVIPPGDLLPGMLRIYRQINGDVCAINWVPDRGAISQGDKAFLFVVADEYMHLLDQAIAERKS